MAPNDCSTPAPPAPSAPILVTGAAGFIGSRVCALLHAAGHPVVGIDNLSGAYDVRLKHWRWAQLEAQIKSGASLELHRLDLSDAAALRTFFAEQAARRPAAAPFSAVINLAARAGVRASIETPGLYYEANVLGALHLLEACRAYAIKKFVLASTSSLYGREAVTPFREEMNTDRPLSPYAATKKAAEALAFSYHHLHGFDISILRYFTVYGPAGRPDMAPLRFVQRIREGRPITVYGDGTQSRDFTYVDDIARGTIAALRPLGFATINLGSDQPFPLSQLISQIAQLTGREPQICHEPSFAADMVATWADITRARELLGWKPAVPFAEGLRYLVDWYEENRAWAHEIETG